MLKQGRGPAAKLRDLTGDLWTVVTNQHSVAPNGQTWFQHALVLRRDPATGQLRIAGTALLSWAE
jgi:hypothetical protein